MRDSLLTGGSVTCDVFYIPHTRCYDLFIMFAASADMHIYTSRRRRASCFGDANERSY